MNTMLKVVGGLVVLVIVVFGSLSIYVSTLDADKYRPQLAQTLSEKTGRKVVLAGPISFSLGLSGVKVSVQDASISNPTWASRPNLASMGKFEVDIGLLPLLAHSLDVKKFAIENADILLETNALGQHNWDMAPPASAANSPTQAKPVQQQPTTAPSKTSTQPTSAAATSSASLSIDELSIMNSQLAMRGIDGKVSAYVVKKMVLSTHSGSMKMTFDGTLNGSPVMASIDTNVTDLMNPVSATYDADVTYGIYHISLKGKADTKEKKASIDSYQLSAGKTTITGTASADWGRARPYLQGTAQSSHIDFADFSSGNNGTAQPAPGGTSKSDATKSSGRMFSNDPLPFDGLKKVDADFQANIDELVLGQSALKKVSAKINLLNGNLTASPVQAAIGDAPVTLDASVMAAATPQVSIKIHGQNVDLSELQKLAGMKPFMTGKAGADIELAGSGNSPHAIASSLGGVIVITAEKGEILGSVTSSISSALSTVFSPGGNNSAINCLAVRFIARDGLLSNNGILVDSAASTVAGTGSVSLRDETLGLVFHAKTKLVDVGGLVPPVTVGGTLTQPSYSIDAAGVVTGVVGNLMNGNLSLSNGAVPDIQAAPAGQNACVYTLDHPKPTSQGSGVLPADAAGRAGQQIKNIGNSLVKGLFGQ